MKSRPKTLGRPRRHPAITRLVLRMARDKSTVRGAVRAPRMNAVMERWIGGCRRELLERTLIWNLPHLGGVLREYEPSQHPPVAHGAGWRGAR
ncbi:hypothetical protein AB5J49_46665 [Streptomyces sp. R28]|uniref:Uncharacterized protein n=1 Tax=Streptomyces sp. R28 TaxID=3238628 RepID=A0AB39QD78_9ACTN